MNAYRSRFIRLQTPLKYTIALNPLQTNFYDEFSMTNVICLSIYNHLSNFSTANAFSEKLGFSLNAFVIEKFDKFLICPVNKENLSNFCGTECRCMVSDLLLLFNT